MFDIINHFLSEYSILFEFVAVIFYVVFGFVISYKTKNINYLSEVFDTMKKILYRTEGTALESSENLVGQSFDENKPTYRLNKASGELEQDGTVNVQELINSAVSVALERMLDKFLPQSTEIEEKTVELNSMNDDLDYLVEAFNKAEDYREKYNLSENLSIQDIYKVVSNKSNELVKQLNDFTEKQKLAAQIKEEVIKEEVVKDEEKTIEKS